MIVDGKAIAEKIYASIREAVLIGEHAPRLAIVTCNPNFETKKYLALKERKAAEVGIETEVIEMPSASTTQNFLTTISDLVSKSDGIIVQLPLPAHVDTEMVLSSVPTSHDVDALNPKTTGVVSPVIGAFREILKMYEVGTCEKYVTIIGSGKLVGLPAMAWFTTQGAYVSVVTKDTEDITHYTKNADIIVCGAGVPGLLIPDMVKEQVIILDAGTSEAGGVLMGDADPKCAQKASIFTPVPGGIGPITVAVLLQNLVVLAKARE